MVIQTTVVRKVNQDLQEWYVYLLEKYGTRFEHVLQRADRHELERLYELRDKSEKVDNEVWRVIQKLPDPNNRPYYSKPSSYTGSALQG